MCFQYYDPCSWDNYPPDGFQSQYGYGLSDQEANCFGKKGKEIRGKKEREEDERGKKGDDI